MSTQKYLIDTNVIIGLEDNRTVKPAFSEFYRVATRHKVEVYVHDAARDDIARDNDKERRGISLSKLEKFQVLHKVRGLSKVSLEEFFGKLRKPNDVVDATLLHALLIGAADFLVTQDKGLHGRARKYSAELGRRVLHVADAVELLKTTFEPKDCPVRFVEEVPAHTIPLNDEIFESLREDYPEFDDWWRDKCVRGHRSCWIIDDNGLAGLVVRKDERPGDTDATIESEKILKICTFKVRPEKRGVKLGELLLKKVFWFAQKNDYDLVYVTAYKEQEALIDLLEYYGFVHTSSKPDGELIYEKKFSKAKLEQGGYKDIYALDRISYPRFFTGSCVRAFGIPIREAYHDVLYPDLKEVHQGDLFDPIGLGNGPKRPGNTIRKVYLCRAKSGLGAPGSILLFYKGKSKLPPSQAVTAVGVLEELAVAESTKDLMHLTGGRSVYSEQEMYDWGASQKQPVKVINYLLVGYIDPPILASELFDQGIFKGHPPQSIFEIQRKGLEFILSRLDLGFSI